MSDKVFLGQRVSKLDIGEKPLKITRINLLVDSDHMYTAGDDTGRTIEKTCPWGTQAMCNSILAQVSGIEYQPFFGESGLIDPAAETGDGITVGGVYSVLADSTIRFNGLYSADIAAPGGNEVEEEYPYKSRTRREQERQLAQTRSSITKTAEQIRMEVENELQGLSASFTVELNGIKGQVNGLDGQVSSLEQTASSITSQITGLDGQVSTLEQTATSLQSQISGPGGLQSQIDQKISSISIGVVNGQKSSIIDVYADGVMVSSDTISFTGDVVFESDLSSGTTLISGDCIRTGRITSDYIDLGEYMTIYENIERGRPGGLFGSFQSYDFNGDSTTGVIMCDMQEQYMVVVTNGGARLTSPTAEMVVATNATIQTARNINFYSNGFNSDQDLNVTSDQRQKEDILYNVDEVYLPIFDKLKPCSFLRKGKGTQRHLGFIAQEYLQAQSDAGVSAEDSVIFSNNDGTYGLTYSEFIPMIVAKIQDIDRKVKDIESGRA